MSTVFARLLGGFIHWLIHGCKTNLKDEVNGTLKATWGGSYHIENYILGVSTVAVIFVIIIWLFF